MNSNANIYQFQNNPFSTNLRPSMDLNQIQDLLGPIDSTVDHYKKTDMQHLSDVFRGQSEYLGSTILNAMLDQNAFMFKEILPMKFTQQLRVRWNLIKMTKTLAEYSADQSVPNMTEAEVQEESTFMVRRGIGMRMDHATWSTPAGKREYVLKAAAMVRAVREVVEQTALLTLLNTENNYGDMYTKGTGKAMFEADLFFFGLLQKEDHGLYVLNKELKNWFQRSGVVPDTYLVPPRMIDFAQLHPSESKYSNAGSDARKNLKSPNKATLGFGDIYEVAPVDMDHDDEAIEPLNRRRAIGGFFAVRDFSINRRDATTNYATKDCNTQIYCAEDDNYHTFNLNSMRERLKEITKDANFGDMHYYNLTCSNSDSQKRYGDELGKHYKEHAARNYKNYTTPWSLTTAAANGEEEWVVLDKNFDAAYTRADNMAENTQKQIDDKDAEFARITSIRQNTVDLFQTQYLVSFLKNPNEVTPPQFDFMPENRSPLKNHLDIHEAMTYFGKLMTACAKFVFDLFCKVNSGTVESKLNYREMAAIFNLNHDNGTGIILDHEDYHERCANMLDKGDISKADCEEKLNAFDFCCSEAACAMLFDLDSDNSLNTTYKENGLCGFLDGIRNCLKLTQEQFQRYLQDAMLSFMNAATLKKLHKKPVEDMQFNSSLLFFTSQTYLFQVVSPEVHSMIQQYDWFICNDIPMPLSWIAIRPRRLYRTGSIIACRRGAQLGCTLYGYPDFQWANDVIGKTMTGHLTFHHSAAVLDPNATMTVHDCIVTGYVCGESAKIYNKSNEDTHTAPSEISSVFAYPVSDPYYGDSTVSSGSLPRPLFFGKYKHKHTPPNFVINDLVFQKALCLATDEQLIDTDLYQAQEEYKRSFKPPFGSVKSIARFCFQEVQFVYVNQKRLGIEDQGHLTSQQRRPGARNMLNGFFTTLAPVEMHYYV